MKNHDFPSLQAYLRTRIAFSGMGKCYIEYPPSPQAFDGIKRPPTVPENNFELRFDSDQNHILLIQAKNQARISTQAFDDSQLADTEKQRFADALHYIHTLTKK
jgi:hypothetical protein